MQLNLSNAEWADLVHHLLYLPTSLTSFSMLHEPFDPLARRGLREHPAVVSPAAKQRSIFREPFNLLCIQLSTRQA
jgi:hypothetical protein